VLSYCDFFINQIYHRQGNPTGYFYDFLRCILGQMRIGTRLALFASSAMAAEMPGNITVKILYFVVYQYFSLLLLID